MIDTQYPQSLKPRAISWSVMRIQLRRISKKSQLVSPSICTRQSLSLLVQPCMFYSTHYMDFVLKVAMVVKIFTGKLFRFLDSSDGCSCDWYSRLRSIIRGIHVDCGKRFFRRWCPYFQVYECDFALQLFTCLANMVISQIFY